MSSWGQNCRPPVILSEAKNLGSCGLHELRRSFLRCTQDRLRLLRMTTRKVFPQPCLPYITADPAGVQKRSKA